MGLGVTAHKNVKKAPFQNWDETEEWQEKNKKDYFKAFVIYVGWRNRISDLENEVFYTSEDSESFVRYSYRYHSFIRSQICEMMGLHKDSWKNYALRPESDFEEWLNFADNEGCISWTTCKKLLKDFQKWQPKAKEFLDELTYNRYQDWIKTFEYASENGAVQYH